MPRQARQLAETATYHVMLRGVNRDSIFLEARDYTRFLATLERVRDASGCTVLAYCLMPNHVHLVIRTGEEAIGAVIKRLGVRYAGWFNRKYGRVGHLFQDRFASRPVEDDAYLMALLRYVWRNPIEAGLSVRLEDYPWSSWRFFGRGSSLLDDVGLRALLPSEFAEFVAGTVLDPSAPEIDDLPCIGRPKRPGQDQAVRVLASFCGAAGVEGFGELSELDQQRAITELRTRSVSYALIAMITGLSQTKVRRMHAGRVSPRVA